MEYIWYIIAAVGAGVGTGLAGLSAATVMVPILIVLCPTFAGEAGAYQATAVALASDILASAATTAIYIRHKNIDLKRGWLMMACILAMCIAGSIAAWHAGNVVLGSFSLFLTFCIGIRFLIKPGKTPPQESQAMQEGRTRFISRGVWIAVSLFFGLTIGFGTGFVGSGGGMMMLVVFTAFLGMERGPAVGTSTLIMTFTAVIASVSHILIDPAIVLERWDALLICIPVALISSIVAARFANRVPERTVGLVTGAVLTALGAAMILLRYREAIAAAPLLWQTLRCFGWLVCYIVLAAGILIVLHFVCRMPRELFRKLLHLAAFCSALVLVYAGQGWAAASLAALLFAALVYPALTLLERWPGYGDLFIQRRPGEIKQSLLLLFAMVAGLIAVCWGLLGRPYLATAAILMWGTGDGMAALVGKRFGRHPIHLPHADPNKTWEGSAAMMVTAFLAGALCLCLTAPFPWPRCLLMAAAAAPLAALCELLTKDGYDTVTVPVVTAAALFGMMALIG